MPDRSAIPHGDTATQEATRTRRPRMFKVLLHNDDYTPMDFVTMILMHIFHKSQPEAEQIMLNVHRKGQGLAGVYTREVAESKTRQVVDLAQAHEFPLQASMEPE